MLAQDIIAIGEGSLALSSIVLEVEPQTLTKDVLSPGQRSLRVLRHNTSYQAMELMQPFDICRISAAILRADFDLVSAEADALCLLRRHNHTAEVDS